MTCSAPSCVARPPARSRNPSFSRPWHSQGAERSWVGFRCGGCVSEADKARRRVTSTASSGKTRMPDLVSGTVVERRRSNRQQSAVEAEHETASGSRLLVAEEADADTRVRRPVRNKRRASESHAHDNKVVCRGLDQGGSSSEQEVVRVLRLYRRCCLCSHAGIAFLRPPREQGGRWMRVYQGKGRGRICGAGVRLWDPVCRLLSVSQALLNRMQAPRRGLILWNGSC